MTAAQHGTTAEPVASFTLDDLLSLSFKVPLVDQCWLVCDCTCDVVFGCAGLELQGFDKTPAGPLCAYHGRQDEYRPLKQRQP